MLQDFLAINFYVAGIPSDQILCRRASLRPTFMLQGFLPTNFYVAGFPSVQHSDAASLEARRGGRAGGREGGGDRQEGSQLDDQRSLGPHPVCQTELTSL